MSVSGAATAAAVLTSVAAMSCIAMPTAAAADKCPSIEVVFARGTDEPPGVGKVGQALVDSLRPMVKGKTIRTYAVDYPASWDFLAVADGAKDAIDHVQATVAKCPSTKIVLGGYSQGAAVIDGITAPAIGGVAITAQMPASAADHVAAVAVFGNPSARLGQPLTILSPVYGARTADLCNTNDPICSQGKDFNSHVRYPESGLVKLAAQWVTKHV